ncbi:MAG: diguanylate cyclase [Nitrospira sp.]|nr:diguanylate cyclase [Nitrospira sp.]
MRNVTLCKDNGTKKIKGSLSKDISLNSGKGELETILDITNSISSTLGLQDILRTIVNKVAEYTHANRCSIILIDNHQKYGYVMASHDAPDINNLQIDLKNYPEIFRTLESKDAVIINDINTDPLMTNVRKTLNQLHIKSLIVIPIVYQDEVIGTLFLKIIKKTHAFTTEEIRFCKVVANTSANAIKNAQFYEQMRLQAKTDGLTNLLNHRSFLEKYQEEIKRSKVHNRPFSILMIDIDNFKSLNDSYGHQYGDNVLHNIAICLKDNTRGIDIVARYGGDEFICLLPETLHDHGISVANRLMNKMKERLVQDNMLTSVSIGIATWNYHTDDPAMLLQLADQAMFIAKYRGGNQIFTFEKNNAQYPDSWNKKMCETFQIIKTLSRFDDGKEIVADLTDQLSKMFAVNATPKSPYEIVTSLSSALDARDHYTNGHSERVIEFARKIACELGISDNQQKELEYLCLLHDIGKIGIPDHILNKPGKLTKEEYEIMKRHPEIGEKIIAPLDAMENLRPLIRHHQECYDGSGYPDGISKTAIPLACRILSVVDTFDAMTSDRPYRKALPREAAIEELNRCAGTQFDPEIVKIFINIVEKESYAVTSA